jgi:demethylspheroidene O-methyltransferase
VTWADRARAWRERALASARFRRWAVASPFTRLVARRRARALFDLCAGFVYSQVLCACVRLRLFDLLAGSPMTAEEVAARSALPRRSALRLLDAAVSLRLLEQRGDRRYGLGVLGAAMIENPALTAMVEHHDMFYADLADPVALLRDAGATRLARYWAYAQDASPAQLPADSVAAYSALMSASQPLVAEEVVAAVSFAGHRRLLDLGGGEGGFLLAVAEAAPGLDLMLFDLPAVAERARQRFVEAGLASRVSVHGGDFHSTPLPHGADIVSLVRVVHDHDDDAVLALLCRVLRVLPRNGEVLIAEPFAGAPGAETVGAAYFGFYLLAMGSGRARTLDELQALLLAAGFVDARPVATRMPLQTGLIVARRP